MAQHQLDKIASDINSTHPNIGDAVALAMICAKAKMCLLVVAPAGCGKSLVSSTVANAYPKSVTLDSVTRSGLKKFQSLFSGYRGLVAIDDLGKVDSTYSRTHTVTSFAELCYSHFISKHSLTVTIEINDYQGAAIINVQPPVLGQLICAEEWEVVTQDKTLRYYHLYRPTAPNEYRPVIKPHWGADIELVSRPRHDYKLYHKLWEIASIQWSDARTLEHLDMLLKATASLDGRREVRQIDFQVLHRLIKPMQVERYLIDKTGFELGRMFNGNLLAVLVEFATWKRITIDRISRDYKIHPATVYRLLASMNGYFKEDVARAKRLVPTDELKRILKESGAV